MKKVFLAVIMFSVVFASSAIPVFAEDGESRAEDFWEEFTTVLPDEFPVPKSEEEMLSGVGVDSFISAFVSAFDSNAASAVSFFAMLLGIAVLMAASESMAPFDNPELSRHISAAVSIIASVLIFGRIGPICFSVKESLEQLSGFFSALIPLFTGILSAGGNLNSAATQALNMNITLAATSYVATSILVPLCFALFALALVGGIDGGAVSGIAKSIKSLFMWFIGLCGTVLVASTAMQSVISKAADSAYLRAAKFAASGMIPVVGSTVSSAIATLAGGLSYAKSTVGICSVTVILTVALPPLVCLLLHRLAFSLSVSFLEFVGSSGGVRIYTAFRSALDALISVYVISAVVYVLEVLVFLKCGVSVFG